MVMFKEGDMVVFRPEHRFYADQRNWPFVVSVVHVGPNYTGIDTGNFVRNERLILAEGPW